MDILTVLLVVLSITFLSLWIIQHRKSRKLENKYSPIISIEKEVSTLNKAASDLRNDIEKTRIEYKEKRELLEKLEHEVAVYDERLSFVELGVYEPHFEFGDSETYKNRIKGIREKQKQMISQKSATICPTNWTVDGSLSKGKTMANRQTRLTMRAFNNECEAAIANTRWNNVVAMEKRILNSAKQIDNANASMNLRISEKYVSLKLEELRLTHELREQQKREKDERVELARAEREEKRLLAEVKAAEREEQKYQQLLERARKEISDTEASTEMLSRIKELEEELAHARSTSERARAMAEMTKSGYVYIISNIGSFGEDVVKIGLTRRLDPEDRVRELGDASVPFKFDTHAMIYSEDAPTLESSLHKEFSDRRINMSNMRKEFFSVKLEEVEIAVKQLAPEANFFKDREAQEWHETLAKREQILTSNEKVADKFPLEI
ncbi:MAG: DUF4041 domain-containing protein [Gammaproteobacteria bacterium]|nr:DUF4041 domain-containing protein [Gammaproteobacteria bacterium]MYL14957.1 DUF4041 domain-containing protein [Gammaproteobacteria bacterium]